MKDFIKLKVRQSLITENRVKHPMQVPQDVIKIQKIFKNNGFKLFIVGGAVRDTLQGKPIKDYDLATDALPDKVEEMMSKAGLRTLGTGAKFGVINVFTKRDEYEIATFREDGESSDSRRPDSVTFSNIETDVKRRDLTINALFYDIETQEIVDLVGGIDDIKNNVVRTVGAPKDRFEEDRLRILRAIRFAARYGSKLDPSIDAHLSKDARLRGFSVINLIDDMAKTDNISPERIRDEFIKSVKSAQSVKYLMELYNKYGLMDDIFPDLDVSNSFINEKDYLVLIAFLLRKNAIERVKKQLNVLTYSSDEVKAISFLLSLLDLRPESAPLIKKQQLITKISDEQIFRFAELVDLNKNLVEAFIKFKLSISGQSVIDKMGLQGADVGKMVQKLEIDNFNKLL